MVDFLQHTLFLPYRGARHASSGASPCAHSAASAVVAERRGGVAVATQGITGGEAEEESGGEGGDS